MVPELSSQTSHDRGQGEGSGTLETKFYILDSRDLASGTIMVLLPSKVLLRTSHVLARVHADDTL